MNLFELVAKIAVDTSEYERTVKSAKDRADDMEDALSGVSDKANKAGKDSTTLANKIRVLERQYSDAADEVDKLTDAFNESVSKTGEASAETLELSGKLKDAEAKAGSLKKELDGLKDGMEDSGKASKGFADGLTSAILKADLLTKGFDLLIGAAKSLASYVWNLDEATEEYRVSQTKLNAAFQSNGFSAATAEQAYRNLYIAVGDTDQATEASQLLASLARNTADVATWTDIATGVVAKWGDSIPVETLIESSNETAKTGQVVSGLADALNWAGQIGEDEFNAMLAECATQEERVQLITDTLMGTYSEAADTFRETAGAVMEARDAHIGLAEAQAEAGEAVARLKNAFAVGFAPEVEYELEALSRFISFIADKVEQWSNDKTGYLDFVRQFEEPINTGSLEEVQAALEALRKEKVLMKEQGGWHRVLGKLNIHEQKIYRQAVDEAIAAAEAQIEVLTNTSDVAQTTADSIDIITASANGLTVELENSGLTAEDASARLQTYTDAALNMFQQISTESEISYADAVANLEANIQATQDFANNMTEIASVLPGNLAEVFAAGGPGVYAGVVSMLAEANRGTDEGLTQINELWRQGGETAVNAFLSSLGMVPAEAENPATIVASQMEQDTTMEIAAEGVVGRTYTAMSSAAGAAGFDTVGEEIGSQVADGLDDASDVAYSAGQSLISQFIAGMESKRSSAVSTANSIGRASASALNSSSGRYSAGGLDYVPYNGYPAILHSGEAVLTASEADDWRRGQTPQARGGIVINQYITAVPQTPAELAAAAQAYFEQARWAV